MQRNIILRSKIAFAVREVLTDLGFLEIETPFMTRSTPEGARDYLVPSRVQPGTFLCAAAIAADLQAAADGQRVREVFPDRALLPRRGSARRPPAGVHADRSGDVASRSRRRIFEVIEPMVQRRLQSGRVTRCPRRFRASPMRRRCETTAATSRTCAFRRCIRCRTCCRSWRMPGLPLVAIHIPKRAARSAARSATSSRRSARSAACACSTTPSAWSATSPSRWPRSASAAARSEDDLLLLAAWAGEPKGHRPEETVYQACGQLRLLRRAEVQRPPQAARPEEFPVPVGGRFPDVRMGRGRQPLERGASSVHLGARRGSRKADHRSGALPRQVLRPGAERHRAGLGLDPYSSPRRAGEGVRGARASPKKKPAAVSASCWTRWNTARRRTAASRWASTGW